MKKKKFNLFKKVFFTLLFGICSIILLGSWTYDPQNDTITSDNLINVENINSISPSGNLSFTIDKGVITINGTSSNNYGVYRIATISLNGTYYINGNLDTETQVYLDSSSLSYPNNRSFTANGTYNINIQIQNNTTFNNIKLYPMLNEGSSALPFEPYGQIYVNQQRLDDLELQYDDLADQYASLYEDWESVTEDYNTMIQEYDNLNALYQQLEQNYNTLETNYNNAIDDLDQLRDEYQSLQDEYAQLSHDYDALESSIKPFVFDYSQFQINIGNATQSGDNFVATQSVSNIASYFDEFGGFNLDALYNNYSGFGSTYSSIEFIVPNLNLVYFNAMFSFSGMPDMNYRIFLTNSKGDTTQFSYDIKDIVFDNQQTNLNFTLLGGIIHSNSDIVNEFVLPLQFTNYSRIILTGLNVGALNVHKISFVSNNSYNIGFQDGYETIKSLTDTTISSLRSSIAQKDDTIRILNKQIVDLNEELMNSVGWKPLFFAIADTPLKTVSSVLGFELFGVNLFKAFVGIVTALALIWLIKKLLGK